MTTAARDEYLDWDAGTLSRATYRLGPEQREAMRRHLRSKLPAAVLDYFSTDPEREQKILDEIRTAFKSGAITSTRQHPLPSVLTSEHLRDVYDDVVGLGPLEALLRDPQVTSISVIRWDTILVERGKEREEYAETFRDQAHLEQVADNLAVLSGYALSRKVRPRMTHFQVDPPARIHIDVSSVDGPFIGFRRGRATAWPLGELVRRGAMSLEVADLLRRLARAEVSMLVVGPPSAGKTTLLEALIHDLPVRHLVVIEDGVNELRPDHPYVTHIVVPPASEAEGGRTAGDMAEAAKSALRKNTDQVIYGEILDGNAGHVIANASSFRFSATTLHGHTIEAGLSRFCILAQLDNTLPRSPYVGLDNLLVRRDLALCFKVVVLCGRLADDRQVVREVAWLDGLGRDGEFNLKRLAWLEETSTGADLEARWQVQAEFALPSDYAVNLYAQDLAAARRLAAGVTPAAAYSQALTAVHSSNWEAAAGFLLQALEAASASTTHHVPGEVIGLLSRVLENGGVWEPLAEHGQRVAQALSALRAERRWEVLEQALTALTADVPLALAVGEAADLADLRHAARRGHEVNVEVEARLAIAERLAGSGRELEALELLLGDFGEGLEVEHYGALAGAAGAMFDRLGDRLTSLQRAAFRARVDALNCLAEVPSEDGEDPGGCPEDTASALSSITAKAQQTAQRITHLAEEAWV